MKELTDTFTVTLTGEEIVAIATGLMSLTRVGISPPMVSAMSKLSAVVRDEATSTEWPDEVNI